MPVNTRTMNGGNYNSSPARLEEIFVGSRQPQAIFHSENCIVCIQVSFVACTHVKSDFSFLFVYSPYCDSSIHFGFPVPYVI